MNYTNFHIHMKIIDRDKGEEFFLLAFIDNLRRVKEGSPSDFSID